ncbi:MAG TPA: hypothetical protein VNX29_03695 [Kaistia sp.]|nr:hypothetical protein [Kaistia sp.]
MTERTIAIQIGAVSFIDEGVGNVLDTVQSRAGVNTLWLATPTWSRASGGRAEPGRAFPDHGKAEYEPDWRGGNYANVHPEYYRGSVLGPAGRAPEYPDWDMLEAVIAEARPRGLKSFAYFDESSHARELRRLPGFQHCLEVDIWNKPARRPCFNNPDYRNWILGIVEDYIKSHELDGLAFCSARPGPLDRLLQEPTRQGLGLIVCYCPHCKARAAERGIDWRRAQEGQRKLVLLNAAVSEGSRPPDGVLASFWRLLLTYPEILAWQALWADGQHQLYRDIFGTIRSFRPDMKVGWDLHQSIGFSPFQRAGQNYADLSHIADFLKISTYHDAGGPRLASFVRNIARAVFGDADPAAVYPALLKMLGLDEGALDELPQIGLSADYVRREVARADIGREGRSTIWAGIGIDIPVGEPDARLAEEVSIGDTPMIDADLAAGPGLVETTPARVSAAVRAAFDGGATGIVLGRKYSEMRLDNLSGVKTALADL